MARVQEGVIPWLSARIGPARRRAQQVARQQKSLRSPGVARGEADLEVAEQLQAKVPASGLQRRMLLGEQELGQSIIGECGGVFSLQGPDAPARGRFACR